MYDWVSHTRRFLNNEKKWILGEVYINYKLLSASKVILKPYTGEVRYRLGEMQCGIVCKGKQYYLPILVPDYGAKPPWLFKNFYSFLKSPYGVNLSAKTFQAKMD